MSNPPSHSQANQRKIREGCGTSGSCGGRRTEQSATLRGAVLPVHRSPVAVGGGRLPWWLIVWVGVWVLGSEVRTEQETTHKAEGGY